MKTIGACLVLQSILVACALPHTELHELDVAWIDPPAVDGTAAADAVDASESGPDADTVTLDIQISDTLEPESDVVDAGRFADTVPADALPAEVSPNDETQAWLDAAADAVDDVSSRCGDTQWNSFNCGACGLRCDLIAAGGTDCQLGQCLPCTVDCGHDSGATCHTCRVDDDCIGYAVPSVRFNTWNGANAHPHCCGGVCAPAGDGANCGGCGVVCAAGQACGWQAPFDNDVSCF